MVSSELTFLPLTLLYIFLLIAFTDLTTYIATLYQCSSVRAARRRSSSTQSVHEALSKIPEAANTRISDALVTDQGLVITLERKFPAQTSLRETHEVMTELERNLKLCVPGVAGVHVDPEILN